MAVVAAVCKEDIRLPQWQSIVVVVGVGVGVMAISNENVFRIDYV
jgi:hypothetical protein